MTEIHQTLEEIDAQNTCILLCGDFNSVPKSHLYNFITTSSLNYKGLYGTEGLSYSSRN